MNWSWKIGRLAGISVYLHWTFLLLLGWIFLSHLASGSNLFGALWGMGFILALFGCVVLHELGHALTARRYGIATKDIILLPIGGVARLQSMPEQPLQELAVAIAGPAVNVGIALLLALVIALLGGVEALTLSVATPPQMEGLAFFRNLMWVNVGLVVFNLIPAFPMDGGRMLRALLAMRLPYERATHIAASTGQLLAILFAFAGLFWLGNPFLLFIALFVYLGAGAEARMTEVRMLLRGVPVRDAMIEDFRTFEPDDSLQQAVDALLDGWQTDFPVAMDGRFLGMLSRTRLATALAESGPEARVGAVMETDCRVLSHRDMLEQVMQYLQQGKCSTLPVLQEGRLVGLVTTENLGELMMVRAALRGERPQ